MSVLDTSCGAHILSHRKAATEPRCRHVPLIVAEVALLLLLSRHGGGATMCHNCSGIPTPDCSVPWLWSFLICPAARSICSLNIPAAVLASVVHVTARWKARAHARFALKSGE